MSNTRDTMPVACTLTKRESALRRDEIAATLLGGWQEVRELPDGYALRFPGNALWAERVLAFITAERSCCPFFTFAVIFEPQEGPLWLHLRGPEGAKDLVASLIAPASSLDAPSV